MKHLQKTLMIVLLSTLGILFSVSNSWAPFLPTAKKHNSDNFVTLKKELNILLLKKFPPLEQKLEL